MIGSLRRSFSDGSRGTWLRPICDGWCMGAPELGWLGKTHAITLLWLLRKCIMVNAIVYGLLVGETGRQGSGHDLDDIRGAEPLRTRL
jgi:hypothetical protein